MEIKGEHGWLTIGAFVITWDILAQETLSSAFSRGLEHHRAAILGGMVITCLHLLDLLPDPIDPFSQLCDLKDKLLKQPTE